MVFGILLLIPLLLVIAGFVFLKTIDWKEFLVQVGAQILFAGICAGFMSCQNTSDTEVWNSRVTKKWQQRVSCSHSYSCNCVQSCSGSGKDQVCTTICDTCYDHPYDWDWNVRTAAGEVFDISRIDRQGSEEPPRWTMIKIGDPTAFPHKYTNYIKAAPGTLFKRVGSASKYAEAGYIVNYPTVYDYYRMNRLIQVGGISVPDSNAWNQDLMELNADLGFKRQVNIIVVLAKNLPSDYFYALEEAWVGGKKNDVVLVIGVDNSLKPQWANVMAWTTREIFKVALRQDIMDEPQVTREVVMHALRTQVQSNYQRRPMADFEYLASSATPSMAAWVVCMILGLALALGLLWYFHKNDPFKNRTMYQGHAWSHSSWRRRFY